MFNWLLTHFDAFSMFIGILISMGFYLLWKFFRNGEKKQELGYAEQILRQHGMIPLRYFPVLDGDSYELQQAKATWVREGFFIADVNERVIGVMESVDASALIENQGIVPGKVL